jgi:hypothetical protein
LATVVLTASERAAEIPPIRVPGMRQEANPAMAAVDRTACQTGIITQDGIQRELILTNKRIDAVVLMPIRAKRKEFPGGYDKNARFSVRMLIVLCMSSSYSLDANASRGRARFFSGSAPETIVLVEQQLRSPAVTPLHPLAQLVAFHQIP